MTREEALDLEARARRVLRDWRFWFVILAVAIGWLYVWQLHLTLDQANANAARIAQQKAQAETQVRGCYQTLRDGPDTVKLLGLVAFLADSQIKANRQALATVGGDPELRRIRHATVERLVPQRAAAQKFLRRSRLSVPTLARCKAQARLLGVDPRPIYQQILKPKETK